MSRDEQLRQIAREAAAALVFVEVWPNNSGGTSDVSYGWRMLEDAALGGRYYGADIPNAQAGKIRAVVAASVLAACERALAIPPLPDGMTAERLEELQKIAHPPNGYDSISWNLGIVDRGMLAELLAYIDHLHSVMRGEECDAYAAGYDAGHNAGYRYGFAAGYDHCTHDDRGISTDPKPKTPVPDNWWTIEV